MQNVSSDSGTNVDSPSMDKMRHFYRGLPDKKRYFEFITAFLSIPVLITVLISNVSNLQNNKKSASSSPAPSLPITIVMQPTGSIAHESPGVTPVVTATPTTTPPSCMPGIGSVEITYPSEGMTVSRDPICVELTRRSPNYCSVTWSYRVNNSAWSDYSDKQICMYGLPPGTKLLDIKVKSALTGDEIILERTFTVPGSAPTPTPATQSATFIQS